MSYADNKHQERTERAAQASQAKNANGGSRYSAEYQGQSGMSEHSQDHWALERFGLRPTGVIPFDQPAELGYWCPVCRVPPISPDGENFNEALHWSEYNNYIWCATCNRDYPSVLCVRIDAEAENEWERVGIDAALDIFQWTVDDARDLIFDE